MQSDGANMLSPTLFLEVPECNLLCKNDESNSFCEFSALGSNNCTKKYYENDVKKTLSKHQHINKIYIYGGEPLLYKEQLEALLNDIWTDGMEITICTNGTLPILNPLSYRYRVKRYIVNLCEKVLPIAGEKCIKNGKEIILGTSDVEALKTHDYAMLKNLCMYANDFVLCFGTRDLADLPKYTEDTVLAIEQDEDEFVSSFLQKHSIRNRIAYMPIDESQVQPLKELCLSTGISFCDVRCYKY